MIYSIDKESFHRRVMWWWIIFGLLVAAFSFWVACNSIQTFTNSIKIFEKLTFKTQLIVDTIKGAGLGTPHFTSFVLNMFIGITYGMFLAEKRGSRKVFLGTVMLFMILSNLLTLTKAGFVSLIVMLHFFLFSFHRLRKNFFRNLTLMYAVLLLLFMLQLKISREFRVEGTPRFLNKAGYAGAIDSRAKYVWIPGVKKLLRSGCLGLGVGTFTYATISPHGHSIYFSTLFDFGIIGAIALLAMLFIIVKNFLIMIKFQETYLQIMFLSCCGVLVSIGVHGLVDLEYNTPVIWLFLGFYAATFLLAQKELAGVNAPKQSRETKDPLSTVNRLNLGTPFKP